MHRTLRMPAAVLAGWAIFQAAGCGGGPGPASVEVLREGPLRDVSLAYRMYSADNKKPPRKPDDLRGYQEVAPSGYRAIKDGSVVVLWGVTLTDLSEEGGQEPSDEVLAYDREVPEQGGNVLLKNRTIKKMTADEFKAAPKAGKG